MPERILVVEDDLRSRKNLASFLRTPAARGGKREGAGRPSTGVRKVQLTLNNETIDKGTDIGEGNLSGSVRIAVKEHRKKRRRKSGKQRATRFSLTRRKQRR
jgi:predicted DNA-binding ribbon-helix-helix protein